MMASKATRYLLRNGMDYLVYREYARALSFFRAVEARQGELSDADRVTLKKGIAQAQQGMREAVNTPRVVAQVKGRAAVQPGAFALARPTTPEPVLLASAELPAPPPISSPAQAAPAPAPPAAAPEGLELPSKPALTGGPSAPPEPLPDPASPDLALPPLPATPAGPEIFPAGLPTAAPAPIGLELPGASDPSPSPVPVPVPVELPAAGPAPTPKPSAPAPMPAADSSAAPAEATLPLELPPAPMPSEPTPAPAVPIPAEAAPPRLALAPPPGEAPTPPEPDALSPSAAPEPPPAPEAPPLPPLPGEVGPTAAPSPSPLGRADRAEPILPPRLQREIEQIAQRPSGDRAGGGGAGPGGIGGASPTDASGPTQGSTRLELIRAPSPTEAHPIRSIPVPEEFVPLGAREWNPNRKYWAAAGTCHMTLYFQDPVLERYGQGVEQSLGPIGRFFSYPLDDPRQSNQRNQILQPFYSIGKFCFQVGTLPYKLLMDPPTEAEYDLGYYRPGDRIPPDTIYITPTGVGPPLKGRHY